jgi:hypothetical protein
LDIPYLAPAAMTLNNESAYLVPFLKVWGEAFEKARHIIHMLGKEPEVLASFGLEGLVSSGQLEERHGDWLKCCSRLYHPQEQDFFKPWWLPLEKDSYEVFLDLSDGRFPVFRARFFFFEPYVWYRETIAGDITRLLLAGEEGNDLEALKQENDALNQEAVKALFRERRAAVFRGEVDVAPLSPEELSGDENCPIHVVEDYVGDLHTVRGAGPLVIGLLPGDLPIRLRELSMAEASPQWSMEDIHCVRDLLFLLRQEGAGRVSSYFMETGGASPASFSYYGKELIIAARDRELVRSFFDRLSELDPS